MARCSEWHSFVREKIQNLQDKRTFECVTCGHKYIKALLSANNKANYVFLAGFLSPHKRDFEKKPVYIPKYNFFYPEKKYFSDRK